MKSMTLYLEGTGSFYFFSILSVILYEKRTNAERRKEFTRDPPKKESTLKSKIMSTGAGTVNVQAVLSDKLSGLDGLDSEGQKISEKITTANIYSYIKEQCITLKSFS